MEQVTHTGDFDLVVRSIGGATPAIHQALGHVLPVSRQELLQRLYQAPSLLVEGISRELGDQISEVLSDAGLDVAVKPSGEAFEAGVGDREVAVHVREPRRFREVAAAVARFLGSDVARAAQVLFASPPVLLGRVSEATVEALRGRIEPLGADVDVSVVSESLYDVFLGADTPRMPVARALHDLGIEPAAEGPLIAVDLTRAQAEKLWSRIDRSSPVQLLDHAFQRYDVRLDEADDTPEVRALLSRTTGMPEKVAGRVLGRLPVVLHDGVPRKQMSELLSELAEAGVRASAHLVTFQTFDVTVEAAADPAKAARILAELTGGDPDALFGKMRRPPFALEGSFPRARARWMAEELRAAGARVRLELR